MTVLLRLCSKIFENRIVKLLAQKKLLYNIFTQQKNVFLIILKNKVHIVITA